MTHEISRPFLNIRALWATMNFKYNCYKKQIKANQKWRLIATGLFLLWFKAIWFWCNEEEGKIRN